MCRIFGHPSVIVKMCNQISMFPHSVIRYRRIAVAMVDVDRPITLIIELENIPVPVIPPPRAQLSVPAAGQWVKQLPVLHTDHGEEILIAQVTPEVELFGELRHSLGLQKLVV